jgi:diguanylate cyclase (GGDEF)-like protein
LSVEQPKSNIHSEQKRRAFVLSLFSIVGLIITAAMGILAYINGDPPLALSLFGAGLVYLIAFLIQQLTGRTQVSSRVVIFSLYSLLIYLVYTGGVANTGPLWIFIVSPVALFIRGLKQGLIELSIFLLIISLIVFVPGEFFSNESYNPDYKLRVMLSFLTVTFLSTCYEYSTEQSKISILELNKQYEQLALYDPLTGLANRRCALQKLEFEKPRILRHNEPLSIIICDVDYFKRVNDCFGHNAGDAVLIKLAEIFTHLIRGQDMVARWGGEEFLFILPHTTAENATVVANKIHKILKEEIISFEEEAITVTVSMGITQMQANQDIDEAINSADKYLYLAKNSGRNQTFPRHEVAEA